MYSAPILGGKDCDEFPHDLIDTRRERVFTIFSKFIEQSLMRPLGSGEKVFRHYGNRLQYTY